jgi:site-specific recombinase XerD
VTPLRKRMLEELQRRNYNPDTIRGYLHAVEEFAKYFSKSPDLMGAEEVRQFQLYMMREKKLALGTVALRMGALRFLYKKTLRRRDIDIDDLPLVRAPKKLPVILSPEEVTRLIEGAPNLCYRTILLLLYATGLRRAEAARLKISDVDSALMLITGVTFRWKDYAHHSKSRAMTLTHEEFLRRFLQHVLPTGFPRIRYFGFLANRRRGVLLPLCRQLLAVDPPLTNTAAPAGLHPCPCCGAPMRTIERLTAAQLIQVSHRLQVSIDSS